jgi:hypothetical protein
MPEHVQSRIVHETNEVEPKVFEASGGLSEKRHEARPALCDVTLRSLTLTKAQLDQLVNEFETGDDWQLPQEKPF